ncbi:MAG: trypsin-like peptidase domain-containing protein, partial [Phycisphaerales bacterium]|nr:trypsin-like peptidase domain-containing protein [Phycisphaerales bacterium]
MSDLSKYTFDVSTTSGIEFKNLRFSKLKLLVEDGTLRPDDLVVVHGAKDQQPRPLGGLKGLNFVAVPTAPVVASGWESSGASTRSGRSPWFLWIAGGASLLGVVFILLLGVVAIFLFKKDTAETTPVLTWEMVLDDQEDAWRAYVNLQSQIGDTIGSNLPSYEEHLRELNESDQLLLSGDDESEVRDEFRFWLPEIVRRSALKFREAHLSEDSKALLSGIAERTEQTDEEVLLDWLICQTLINHGLVFEIWRHEYDLSESSGYTELVSRVGLLGEETRPILERSKTELIRRSGERIKFRLFGGTFDIVSTLPGGEGGESGESGEGPVLGDQPIEMRLSGDYIWMRHLVFGTLEENPDGDRSVQLVREGDVWRGTWRHTIEDYADTYEIYPWARDLVVAGQIAQTNLIPDGTEAPAEEALSAAEWKRIYGRSVPLIVPLREDGTKTRGNGTGFLIEHQERLYIVTNRHVIDGTCSDWDYRPAKTAFMAMHMTLDDTSKITALHEYRLDSSAFKVHPDGIDIAIADVTDRRADFEENFIQPLPIKFDGVPGDGDDLVWIGHPDSFTGAAEGDTPEGSAYWE